MTRIDVNGVYYHVQQQGEGTPLVLLHGFTGSSENWLPHIEIFSPHFRVIAVDLLGHGQSAFPPAPERYGMEPTAADLVAIFDQLAHQHVHLLGYSMGGRLALYMAIHHSAIIRSLILESASPGLETSTERNDRMQRDNQLADRIEQNGIASFVEEWEKLPLFATQEHLPAAVRDRLHIQRLRNNPSGLANSLRGMGTGVQPSLWEHLREVNKPTLLIAGELDAKFVQIAAQMQPFLLDARLKLIPHAGHTTHLEQPDHFNRHVLEFLT